MWKQEYLRISSQARSLLYLLRGWKEKKNPAAKEAEATKTFY